MRQVVALVLGLVLLAACGERSGEKDAQTKIFLNGTVYTGLEQAPTAQAVVVEDARISFVGSEEDARERAPGAGIVDLGGAYLYPGFTDAHMHLLGTGQREIILNLEGSASIGEVQQRLKAYAESVPGDAPIVGRGWIETHWPEARFLDRHDLDAVVAERPVYLGRADGHAAVVNSKGLELLGITRDTPDPGGGRIERDADGEPTGLLVDAAKEQPERLFYAALNQRRPEAYARAAETLAARGWTGVHNMGDTYDEAEIMERLADAGDIKIRVYNVVQAYFPDLGVDQRGLALLEEGPRASANGLVVTRAIKLYMDGALGSRGALLLEPYADAETSGLLLADKETYLGLMERALRAGIQVANHAIGDAANRMALDWYAEALAAVPEGERAVPEPRFRIEHAQHVSRADWPRFAELGVIPSMQPSHAIGDLYFAPSRLGSRRLEEAYPWKPLIEAGAVIPGGSDAPVEKGDPRIEFYAAVARQSLNGYAGAGWHPEYAVSRRQALKMLTLWPAYAAFREHELGTVAAGKLADFTVFGADIMTIPAPEIPEAPVVMTVVGGEIVYRNPEF